MFLAYAVTTWPLPDPKSLPLEEVRKVRNEVKHRVVELIHQEHLR